MATDEQPAIVSGATHTIRTLVDGTMSLTLHIEPRHAQAAFAIFGSPGTPVAVARLVPEAAQKAAQQTAQQTRGWGHLYQDLFRLGWWHNPRVIEAFGAFGVESTSSPNDRIETIKAAIYLEFNVESLTELEPQYLVRMCESLDIRDTLPASVIEAARGRSV